MPTLNMMAIHDDRVGEGANLAFPTMSTCAAIICVLDNTLLGIHKTQGSVTAGHQIKIFDYALGLLNNRTVHKLIIVGWNVGADAGGHSVTEIRNKLKCQNVATYYFNYATTTKTITRPGGKKITQAAFKTGLTRKKMSDLCTFVEGNGTGFPGISMKRTTKVTNTQDTGQLIDAHGLQSDIAKYGSVAEDVTTTSDHIINMSKFSRP